MKDQAKTILDALLRGERISPKDSTRRYGIMALAQRVSELRKLGYPIKDFFPVRDGRVQKYKVYFIEAAKPPPAPKPEVTIVTAHTRRRNVIEQEPEEQISLFG